MRFTIDHPDLHHLIAWVQDGIVTRRQLLGMGATPHDIRRLLRRRDLVVVHPGVYAAHTGRLSLAQREWAAVLAAWPAALCFESAPPERGGRAPQVAIDRKRSIPRIAGVAVHRMADLDARADWDVSPPRVRLEHATIDTMSRAIAGHDVPRAFTVLSEVLHSRRTDAMALTRALQERKRVAGRRTIAGLLDDATSGACSVLERGYLHRVERAHSLPRGTRQRRSDATGRTTYQDVRYDDFGLIVELDGRAFHDSPGAHDRDARRDLAELATSGDATARVTYGLVFGDQCRTAGWIARVLRRRGWRGPFMPCPSCRAWQKAA